MSGFNTKERNNNGEFEITFYTENQQDFKKVQDLCRELIGHGTPVSNEGDLISREALKEHKFLSPQVKVIGGRHCGKIREQIIEAYQKGWNDCIDAIIDNAPTVDIDIELAQEREKLYEESKKLYMLAKTLGKEERPQAKSTWRRVTDDENEFLWFRCMNCRQISYINSKYCPNCGCGMKGEKNETDN